MASFLRVAPAVGDLRASGPAVRRDSPGHLSTLRLALQAEGHQPPGRQCLHPVATSRFPPPRVAPAVAGRRASGPSRPTVRRDSPRPPPGVPVGPPGGTSPAARSTMPASPAPGTDRLPPLGAVGPEVFGPAAPAPRRRCEL